MNKIDLFHFFASKTGYALLCGAVIGFERERKSKTAGLKTNMLICLGAMLYTATGELLGHDQPRLIANIVTGIGFLGAGAIIHPAPNRVSGLTTAAMMWVVAALGILVGLNYGSVALSFSLLIAFVSTTTSLIERKLFPVKNSL